MQVEARRQGFPLPSRFRAAVGLLQQALRKVWVAIRVLEIALRMDELQVQSEVPSPVIFRQTQVGYFKADLVVDQRIKV